MSAVESRYLELGSSNLSRLTALASRLSIASMMVRLALITYSIALAQIGSGTESIKLIGWRKQAIP